MFFYHVQELDEKGAPGGSLYIFFYWELVKQVVPGDTENYSKKQVFALTNCGIVPI